MKIKSFILACSFLALSVSTYAQKGVLNSAKSDYEKYTQLKNANTAALGVSSLNSAKESIDKASANAKTSGDPATWTYRALIYADLALLDTVQSKTDPLVKEAASSLKKASELDKEGQNKANIDLAGKLIAQSALNKGVREFQAKNYEGAYNSFNEGLVFMPTDSTFNYYAGLAAINLKDYDKAIEKYNQLTKTNFSIGNQVYLDLSRLYALKGDTTSAIRVASEGTQKYPKDAKLATQEIELGLVAGKQKEIVSKISAQAEKDPSNKTYPFYLGVAYNSLKDYQKAEEAYKKALAIDPNFADANLNLGGVILNNAIDIYNKARNIPTNKQTEYNAMLKKANVEADRALPYIQKANELNPKSVLALENLKTYYLLKNDTGKVAEIKKKIDALQ
ncbi:tetratricopeptide repeat protein [Rubrolithibacter danxiaensis]|uniref:tetratricopeptide repeat protein n=1 Tax=Rubrolithibacter danxiaensis TaxID=3390805 RepID=UPI003BF8F66C